MVMAQMQQPYRAHASIPASAGIGLRSRHFAEIADNRPKVSWFEAHSENYFGKGGLPLFYLEQVRKDYPVSLHGVGLSLGSVDPMNQAHLQRLKVLIERIEPGLVSEHLSWSSFGGAYLNDLAPLPYTRESLAHLAARVEQAQSFLGRQILIENPSSYLAYRDSTYRESEFLAELSRRSGCGILLDINNAYVSCRNHSWNALTYLHDIPADKVCEMHLAGHAVNYPGGKRILIDTHDRNVSEEVWELYGIALRLTGPKPTLIEWDTDVPEFAVLQQEARKAETFLEEVRYERVA
jgi:uncharacterized protein (UPF0276 family)